MMLTLILKSTACLTVFLIFYKVLLEKESVHQFKRFFLLGALIASFIIPNLVFIEYIDAVEPATNAISSNTDPISDGIIAQHIPQHSVFDWQLLLWLVYGLGVIGFGLRFIANLFQIRLRIKKNPKFKENFVTKVLLNQSLPPHTFLNFIFLNQHQFEAKNIPEEVLLHEETHARQRHSWDILLVEIAQVIFWFNPLIYFFKSSIKLNHEFLADQAVIHKTRDQSHYQKTILSYLSKGIEHHQSVGIANAINYSSIKKRFTVMKTNTSKKSFVLRSFLLLPLTALLLFGFSEHRQIEKGGTFEQIITLNLLENGMVALGNRTVHLNEVPKTLLQDYLQNHDALATKVEINSLQPVHYDLLLELSKAIKTTGITAIEIAAEEVVMDKAQFKEHVPVTSTTTLLNTKKMTVVDHGLQTQQSATRKEMKEYNALAKKYNDMDRDHMVIQKKEVMRLKEIYTKMSKKQRADAEPFPNFPPPPPAPDATTPPTPPAPPKSIKATETPAPTMPPAPPAPPKPIEHVKKMVAKGASFTLNGKEISSKKALEVVQKKQFISMLTMDADGANPVVNLSTEP